MVKRLPPVGRIGAFRTPPHNTGDQVPVASGGAPGPGQHRFLRTLARDISGKVLVATLYVSRGSGNEQKVLAHG